MPRPGAGAVRYQARDGEETRRLVEPHQLVSAGRRWYLVAWDVRRTDWRTFRLDRLSSPQLAGVQFEPRALPAADAAAYVAQFLGSLPKPHEATVVAEAPLEVVQPMMRWAGAEVERLDDQRCRVGARAESVERLVTTVAVLGAMFEIEVDAAPDALARLGHVGTRVESAAARQ